MIGLSATAGGGPAQLPVVRGAQRAWRHDGSCGVAEERTVTPLASTPPTCFSPDVCGGEGGDPVGTAPGEKSYV